MYPFHKNMQLFSLLIQMFAAHFVCINIRQKKKKKHRQKPPAASSVKKSIQYECDFSLAL